MIRDFLLILILMNLS